MTEAMTEDSERRLAPVGAIDPVFALSVWDGRLISGHGSGKLRVWTLATGACEQVKFGAEELLAECVALQRVEFEVLLNYCWRQSVV